MSTTLSLFLFCACAVTAIASGMKLTSARVGLFVALTCEDEDRQAVLNATVQAAISRTAVDSSLSASSVNIEFDVVDVCLADSVTRLALALEAPSSSYTAVAGPGLYHLCGIASALQPSRPVRDQLHCRHHYHHGRHDQVILIKQAMCRLI